MKFLDFFNNVQCAPTEGTMVPFHGQIYIWLTKTITDNSSINLMNLHIECNSNFKEKRSGTKKKATKLSTECSQCKSMTRLQIEIPKN